MTKMTNTLSPEVVRLKTGVEGLDDILGGGLPQGHFFLLEGDPGAGKTTVGLQFLLAGVPDGESVVYATLSESKAELQAIAASHGFDLSGVHLIEFASEEVLKPEAHYTVFHPSEIELADTTRRILDEVARLNPSRLVIDSLSELRVLARDALRYRRQIMALKKFFERRQTTVLLLDDRTGENRDVQLYSISHGVISMEKLPREYGVTRRRIEIVKLRGVRYREGFHDYRIQTGGVKIFPRLVASEHPRAFEPGATSSGIAELDALLGGGLDRGSSTLLIGPAGCGKSTLALRFTVTGCSRGERAAVYTFEEGRQIVLARAAGLGMDLKPYLENGSLTLEQINPAEMSPGEFVENVRKAIQNDHVRMVVIDSLNGFLQAMPGEEFLAIQLHELLAFLNQSGVLTLMILAQAGVLGASMQTPADISYLADNILMLRYFEASGAVKKAISVVKKRSGGHEHTIRELRLEEGRVTVGEPLTQFQGVLTGVPTFLGGPALNGHAR